MLKFITGGAGYGKSTLLIDKIGELADTEKKIIFIVPEQFSFESDKKIYKALGAKKFNKILSVSFTSLTKEIFEKYGGRSGEYAEDIHKYILMNKTIKELSKIKAFQYYDRQSKKISFINDALQIVNEFRQCGISPDELVEICNINNDSNEKINDLSMIYTTYDRMLTDNNLKDSLTDISEAAAVANLNDYFKNCIVIMDEFESFTGDEYELIDAMFAQADDIYIGLRLENIGENSFGIFDSVEKTWKSFYQLAKKYNVEIENNILKEPVKYKNLDLAFLNKNIMRNNENKFDNSDNIKILECKDLYEEADFVCAQIRELVYKHNYKYKDIAIISRQLDEYVYILDAAFKRYDIPAFMDIKKNAFHTQIMQLMVNTVNIMCEPEPDTETILKYVKTLLNNIPFKDIAALENYCYEWEIEGKSWFEPFTIDIENNPYIENIRNKIMTPVIELREKNKKADCKKICHNLYDFLYKTKVPLRIAELNDEMIKSGLAYKAKEQKRMWDALMTILETFADMGGDISLKEFQELFNAVVSQITYALPPQTLDSVHAAKAETARLASPKAVFILGVNEGFFPLTSYKNSLLNEKDRIKFEKAGVHLSRGNDERVSDEKLIVYKSLTHASEKLYITYPTSDSSGIGRYKASIINQIIQMFNNNIFSIASDKGLVFYSSTLQSAYYNFVQNFGKDVKGIPEIKKVLKENDCYSTKIDYLYEVSKKKDFQIDNKELMKKLYTQKLNLSATRFEEFNLCHFKFFCNTGLKLRTLKKRQIGSLEQGNIVHSCLEAILSSCKTKKEFDSLEEVIISDMINQCVDKYMNESMGGEAKKTLRTENNINNIKNNIIKIVLHLQNEMRQSEFRPVEFEYIINENGLPLLKTKDGIEIILRGVVDRIDMYEENGEKYIRVIDYKTGKKKFAVANLLYGIDMQMLLYMFSITDENGKYSDCNPAGVLYMPSKEIECERDRDDTSDIDDFLNRHYKMNGVILKDRTILSAMEKEIKGVYIPAKLLAADSGSGEVMLHKGMSTCFTSSQFVKLKKHIENLMENLADELYGGKINADPLVSGKSTPCSYCDYWSICGNVPNSIYHETSPNAEDEMYDLLNSDN